MTAESFDLRSNPPDAYRRYGCAVLRALDDRQVSLLRRFAKDWVYRLMGDWAGDRKRRSPLGSYHIWSKGLGFDHAGTFKAGNRHTLPGPDIQRALLNQRVKEFLQEIGLDRYELWDEGLGWLGFRFIRPGAGDGYPFSRKAWGVAKEVISCWIPIIGYDRRHTLTLVPGSHRKNYERYLPEGQKFAQGEYRLARIPPAFDRYNPGLKRGEVVFYHPKTLHSEDVLAGRITRLNLEFRINPLSRQGGDSNQ